MPVQPPISDDEPAPKKARAGFLVKPPRDVLAKVARIVKASGSTKVAWFTRLVRGLAEPNVRGLRVSKKALLAQSKRARTRGTR